MPTRRRTSFPGLPQDAVSEIVAMQDGLIQDTADLRADSIGRTTDTKTAAYSAKLNEAIRVQMPAAGGALTFPSASVSTADKWIEVIVLGGGAVRIQPTSGQIDGAPFVSLTTAGRFMFRSDGLSSWWRATGGPPPAGSVPLTALAAQAANTVVANATAAAASPTAFPVGVNTVLGRVAGNIVAAQLVGAQVAAATLTNALLATMAANTIKANATAGVATPTDVPMANAESVFGRTSGNLQAIDSAVQTALIRAAGSVFWAAAAANQVLRRSGAGDLGFGTLVDGNIGTNQITAASQAQMAANSVKANATAGAANEADLAVGANTVLGRVAGNIVAAALVGAQVAANTLTYSKIAQPAANTMPANATAGAADLADIALAAQSVLGRAAANIVNLVATAGQFLGRSVTGNLAFQLKGLVSSNTTRLTATNATTNLSCGGSFTIPANTLEAGAVYRATGQYLFVHTAAATPTITIEILLAGAVILTQVITPVLTATTYTGTCVGYLRCQTTGAGGTCCISLDQKNTYATVGKQNYENQTVGGTTAIDTTASKTFEMRIRMTTAVAANTLTLDQGFVEKL